MYDTARRVELVKRRVREMTRRKRRRGIYGLSAVCMLLFAAMIEAAGLGVAMGNATDDIRKIADATTDDNNHDGVAAAIEKYVL